MIESRYNNNSQEMEFLRNEIAIWKSLHAAAAASRHLARLQLADVESQRDAALEEVEQLRHERDTYAANEQYALKSWMKSLDERDAAIREHDEERLARISTETERDFARREKDAGIFHIKELKAERDAAIRERDAALDRVKELEAQRLTTAKVEAKWTTLSELMLEDPEFAWSVHCDVACPISDEGVTHQMANLAAARIMQNFFGVDVTRYHAWESLEQQWKDAAIHERDAAQPRVAELEEREPATDSRETVNADAEPVYLWCDYCGSSFDLRRGGSRKLVEPDNAFGPERWKNLCVGCDVDSQSQVVDQQQPAAEPVAEFIVRVDDSAVRAAQSGLDVGALRRPQPRGWLTREEIAAVRFFADWKNGEVRMVEEIEQQRPILDGILSRNAPPTVRLPSERACENENPWAGGWNALLKEVRAALAVAGVEVE